MQNDSNVKLKENASISFVTTGLYASPETEIGPREIALWLRNHADEEAIRIVGIGCMEGIERVSPRSELSVDFIPQSVIDSLNDSIEAAERCAV